MMYRVVFSNSGGELDSRAAATQQGARMCLIDMLNEVGFLSDGDTFTISEVIEATE